MTVVFFKFRIGSQVSEYGWIFSVVFSVLSPGICPLHKIAKKKNDFIFASNHKMCLIAILLILEYCG